MATPAPKPPVGNSNDEALDILRRLEPVLSKLDERTQRIEKDIGRIDSEQREQRKDIVNLREDMARIDGRLIELSARVPSIWTIAAMIVSLFGAAFVLIRFASGHG